MDDHVATGDRLTTISANSSYVDFKFASVSPQDNGLEFICSLDDNGTEYNSENLTLNVMCELLYCLYIVSVHVVTAIF